MVADRRTAEPRIAGAACARSRNRTFRTHDGVELFYRHWPAASPAPQGAIVLFHRGHEHSGRMAHLVDELDLPDFAVFAWDARGHGRSPGERGFARASAPRCATSQTSSATSRPPTASPSRGHGRASRRASAPCWSRPGRTTTRPGSAPGARLAGLQGEALRALRPARASRCCTGCAATSSSSPTSRPQFLTHDPERIASFEPIR